MTSVKIEDAYPMVAEPSYERLSDVSNKSPRTKYLIIGVSVITVTLIVTLGFLGATFFVKDTANTAITSRHLSLQSGSEVIEETIEEYPDAVTQYSVDSPTGRFTVLDDASRKIKVMVDGKTCTVSPLTGLVSSHQAAESDPITDDNPTREETVKLDYVSIKDHAILGAHAQKLCSGLPLYWATITPKEASAEPGRNRRGGCVNICYHNDGCKCKICVDKCW